MFSLFTLGLMGVVLFGLIAAGVSLVFWILTLPFRILGLVFRGLACLLALPFLLLFGILGVTFLGVGALLFFVPVVPFLLLAGLIWWLVRRNRPRVAISS